MVTSQRHFHLEPQNFTLHGIKVCVDIIKVRSLRQDCPSLWQALNPMRSVYSRKPQRQSRRGSDTPVHRPEKPASSTYKSTSGLSPVSNARVKRSSIPPHKTRPDSPVPTLQGLCDPSQIRRIQSQERNPVVPASTCHEALFHCTKPSGVPRGPSQLHSDPDFSEAR